MVGSEFKVHVDVYLERLKIVHRGKDEGEKPEIYNFYNYYSV